MLGVYEEVSEERMPRTKEFEPEKALERAMELFWVRGYEATSVQELLDRMGIGRGSFYDTFGDKHALFLAALDRYEEVRSSWIVERLDDPGSVRGSVEDVFGRTVERLSGEVGRRGCLLANTAVELAPHDPEVEEKIRRYLQRTEDAFHRALVRARASGEIGDRHDPRSLARFFVNSLQGLRVMAKVGSNRAALEDAARVTLSVLD